MFEIFDLYCKIISFQSFKII